VTFAEAVEALGGVPTTWGVVVVVIVGFLLAIYAFFSKK